MYEKQTDKKIEILVSNKHIPKTRSERWKILSKHLNMSIKPLLCVCQILMQCKVR